MSKISVVGSINIDLISHIRKFPQPGETVLGGKFSIIPGGKGANQAVSLARLGNDVSMIGKIGVDELGKSSLEILKMENINNQ